MTLVDKLVLGTVAAALIFVMGLFAFLPLCLGCMIWLDTGEMGMLALGIFWAIAMIAIITIVACDPGEEV